MASNKKRGRPPAPPDDPTAEHVWGAKAIGAVINRNERQTYYLVQQNLLEGVEKLGPKMMVGYRSKLKLVRGQ